MRTTQSKPAIQSSRKLHIKFPSMYPKQKAFFDSVARYTIVEAATKCGKTAACLIWLLYQAMTKGAPGRNFWWVAPVSSQAKIAFRRLKIILLKYPDFATFNESEIFCKLTNGAIIWFKSADKPDSLYGEDVYAAVMDEATRAKEDSWNAVRSTLTATRGPVKIIGNVRGRNNWAYRLARKAESGMQDTAYFRLTAYDAAEASQYGIHIYDIAEIEDAKRMLPEAAFNELYLCIPSDDGTNPFGLDAIKQCIAPLSNKLTVCFGIDLAKSSDWTVVIGLDEDGCVCVYERWQGTWLSTITRIASIVGDDPALVDSTGVGDPVLEQLQLKGNKYEGYKFSSASKQQLMEGLAVGIQSHKIWYPEGVIVSELSDFEYEYTKTGVRYNAPQGLHDDTVCALSLAWQKFSTPFIAAAGASTTPTDTWSDYGADRQSIWG